MCGLVLSFRSTTNNLKRHIERRNVTVNLNAGSKKDTVGDDRTMNDITDNGDPPVSVNSICTSTVSTSNEANSLKGLQINSIEPGNTLASSKSSRHKPSCYPEQP